MRRALSLFGLLLLIASAAWLHFGGRSLSSTRADRPAAGVNAPDSSTLVILDPGHGGQDSGAICGGILEKDLTLDVARRAERLLRAQGLATLLTRTDDTYVPLSKRAQIANRQSHALFISIHFNDAKPERARGVETYFAARQISGEPSPWSWLGFVQPVRLTGPNESSRSLAGFIQDALIARTQAVNRGTKTEQFYVIANVCHPAVLVEGGFITNKLDAGRLTTGNYREQIAAAICEGVLHYRELDRPRRPAIAAMGP